MTITLELPDALEHRLLTKAAQLGLSLDRYIIQDLDNRNQPSISVGRQLSENALLKKIKPDLGIAIKEWNRYDYLIDQLRKEQISENEHIELIALIDKVEIANAERLGYLFQLSKLRRVSVQQLMSDLGIRQRDVYDE